MAIAVKYLGNNLVFLCVNRIFLGAHVYISFELSNTLIRIPTHFIINSFILYCFVV